MILLHIEDFAWGTAPIEGHPTVRRINIKDNETKMQLSMSFGGEPLFELIGELIPALEPKFAAQLIPALEVQSQLDPSMFTNNDDPEQAVLDRDPTDSRDD